MSAEPAGVDVALAAEAPALWEALSPLGRSLRLPESFLPQQTAEARGKAFNATIGQITDGRGHAVPLSAMAEALSGLGGELVDRALLYSPVEGLADLRKVWREQSGLGGGVPASLPIVTAGPVQALSILADLFLAPGRAAVLAGEWEAPEVFTLRTGAREVAVAAPAELARALDGLPAGEPALVALRAPGLDEARSWVAPLLAGAGARPLAVVIDDSGAERGAESLYGKLAGRHPGLLAFRVESAEGLGFAGAGLGFLTLPFEPGSAAAKPLEDKVKILLRAAVGSPPAATQAVLLRALDP